ncbi:YopX family protein, partial [Streptococcus suis]|uniref:YopX family protein n=1 Tax=Streptococcus suis TaxID=1307 RepID=UPI0005CDBC71
LMQSTGVFDKNGQEIFEGDVVNIFGEKLSKIYYSEGAFCVEVLNGGTPLHVYLSEHLEIIGNIYEDPELVEGQS